MTRKRLDVRGTLASLPLFQSLRPEELASVAQAARIVRARRGELLFGKGDTPAGFHVVVSGQVKLALSTSHGLEKVLQILGPGQSFGEAVMFLERPYPVHGACLVDSVLLLVPRHALCAAIEADPGFARRVLGGLSVRLHQLVSDVEAYSTRSAAQRLVGYLLHLREAGGEAADEATGHVSLPTSKHIVASRLNLTPETLSRVLHVLSADHLISVDGRDVTIRDVQRLRAYA
ncbi:MAG TPA: Crp/Fnr family transcriptional regulator [Burkholderiaceae bacterium]